MIKNSSILDYQKDYLCPQIWDEDNKLKKSVENFIISQVEAFFISLDLEGYQDFIYDIYIGSSIATYFYTDHSDVDIKIVMDIKTFNIYNSNLEYMDEGELLKLLVDTGRESSLLTSFIPETKHELDAYFYSVNDLPEEHLIKYDSLYSMYREDWIKEPIQYGSLASKYDILSIAKNKAELFISKLDSDIARAKRDSIDFLAFMDYLKSLDSEDLSFTEEEFQKVSNTLNDSLMELVDDKELVKYLRKYNFSKETLQTDFERLMGSLNFGDGNLIFKVLQRYGYNKILAEISDLKDRITLNEDSVTDILNILK